MDVEPREELGDHWDEDLGSCRTGCGTLERRNWGRSRAWLVESWEEELGMSGAELGRGREGRAGRFVK